MSNSSAPSSVQFWEAPTASSPVVARVVVPGSKSITNRAYVIAALASSPTIVSGALRSRDTNLMAKALADMGTEFELTERSHGSETNVVKVTPRILRGGTVDTGLAGTVMRFLPAVAALASGTVFFDGDPEALRRPMREILDALRSLGVKIEGDGLPFQVHGHGQPTGGVVEIDASRSSQFVSGLLLAGARFRSGVTVRHTGDSLPSMPHIKMTVEILRQAGVPVDDSTPNEWTVSPCEIRGGTIVVEPDLSNATPFLAAAAVTGGKVTIPNWPARTTQPGDAIRGILEQMGCTVELIPTGADFDLKVTGPEGGKLKGVDLDMGDIGELTPTVAALAALAETESTLTGIAHLRGHETDRLAALSAEINKLGGNCVELDDGLRITPAPLHGGKWHSYADHRMATAGAIIGLVVPEVQVQDIQTTAKTMPGFEMKWAAMVGE